MKKLRTYLAGRMSGSESTRLWRDYLTPFLEELGFEVFNPFLLEPHQLKGLKLNRLPEGMKHWYELRDSDKPEHKARFNKYMRRIIRYDINLIQKETDIVICHWDDECSRGAGTHAELTIAFLQGIPVYCVNEGRLPAWAQACCEEIFSSFDELKTFLKEEYE